MTNQWALEAREYKKGDPFCFCPIEEDGSIVLGMNFLGSKPPGEFVAIFHEDGKLACDEWCERNMNLINQIMKDQ